MEPYELTLRKKHAKEEQTFKEYKDAIGIESVSKKDVVMAGYDELMKTDAKDIISFGYHWLDIKLSGIFPGQLILVGGESGTGKSTFTISIIYKCKQPTAVFALEERLEDYGKKTLYFEIGKLRRQDGKKQYPWNAYIRGEINKDELFLEYVARAYENLNQKYPYFQKMGKMATIDLVEKRLELLAFEGIKLVLIDHLHYFDLLVGKNSKTDYIEQIMIRLRLLAIRLKISIIIVAHYRKLNGNRPTLDSFKDSIAIVQNASTVINLWRNREEGTIEDKYKTQFIIPKSRDLGGEGKIDVIFNPSTGEYEKAEKWIAGVPVIENNYDINKLDL
jgi:replicative DNA helicase